MPHERPELVAPPERAAAAHQAVAVESRLATLRFLLENPGATVQELVPVLGISAQSTRANLAELEAAGFVTTDAGDGPRNGKVVRYRVDRERFTTDLLAFVAWVLR
ncbi:ArsR/SmtB family transcription factor [Amnibacterium flavum]|uniref:ArsR/SmtB family transcription factor n=1 Tax=Amnibacterium flavum TaxID=2173173 RepID=UPI001402DFE5|nr:helix-turn-helix domain-containing protein [Amnibacterium flavum]